MTCSPSKRYGQLQRPLQWMHSGFNALCALSTSLSLFQYVSDKLTRNSCILCVCRGWKFLSVNLRVSVQFPFTMNSQQSRFKLDFPTDNICTPRGSLINPPTKSWSNLSNIYVVIRWHTAAYEGRKEDEREKCLRCRNICKCQTKIIRKLNLMSAPVLDVDNYRVINHLLGKLETVIFYFYGAIVKLMKNLRASRGPLSSTGIVKTWKIRGIFECIFHS